MRSFPDTKTIAELQQRGVTVLVLHEEQGSRPSYAYALERLVRDPSIKVIAEDREDGRRVAFFELLPARRARRLIGLRSGLRTTVFGLRATVFHSRTVRPTGRCVGRCSWGCGSGTRDDQKVQGLEHVHDGQRPQAGALFGRQHEPWHFAVLSSSMRRRIAASRESVCVTSMRYLGTVGVVSFPH